MSWLLASAVVLLLACGGEEPGDVDTSELDALRALGYVEVSQEKIVAEEPAVSIHDPQRAQPGLTLVTTMSLALAQLIDMRGEVVHTWHHAGARRWAHAEILPGGDVLASADQGRLLRMSWDGEILWMRQGGFHHDVGLTPDGRVAALARGERSLPRISQHPVLDDDIVLLSAQEGEELERHSIYDMLAAAPDVFRFQSIAPSADDGGRETVDLLHSNSVELMRLPRLAVRAPFLAPGHALVCMRHQDSIAIFDLEGERVVWAWGQGEISGPHDATVLENGHILLFDNGLARGWSRVVELDPLTREIVWEFRAPLPERFYSPSRGSSQRLANGNTLISYSTRGEAFEVTRGSRVVWRWRSPITDDQGRRRTIVRAVRYPASVVPASDSSESESAGPPSRRSRRPASIGSAPSQMEK